MKNLWFRSLLGALLLLGGAAAARAQNLSPTGISATPGSAAPGDTVTYAIQVSNSAGVDFNAPNTVTISVVLTNLSTGYSFAVGGTVAPTTGLIGRAVTDLQTGQTVAGTGTFSISAAVPTQVTHAGNYRATVMLSAPTVGTIGTATYAVATSVLTVTGKPDLEITSLTYAPGTSYVGGQVVPMTLTFGNRISTNGAQNVPYVPAATGHPAYVRIQVVLSANPTYGDDDDFQLTIYDIGGNLPIILGNGGASFLNADGANRTISWNQILPGNFSGSYYVLAKIDSLNALDENDPPNLTVNGNNIWSSNAFNPAATLINLLPSNFPTMYTASHATGSTSTGNGYSDNPAMTADGRYVVFSSDATNLVASDTNGFRDIFIFDSQTNVVRRLSVSQQGAQANGASNNATISAGTSRYVAFSSDASNLVIGDTNGFSDIFVVDTLTGIVAKVSGANAAGGQANNPSFRPAISSTGRYVAFESTATNLTATPTIAGRSHIYVYDRDVSNSGTFDTAGNTATTLVSVAAGGGEANGSSIQATISADGTTVAWASDATNLVATDTNGVRDVFVRNLAAGTNKLVSVANGTAAQGDAASQTPSLSADGRWVAFASLATNLLGAGGDTNGVSDIFVYDGNSPVATPVVVRVSVTSGGLEATDPSAFGFQLGSINPSISADGRFVAYASLASNLTSGDIQGQAQATDANNALDIFVRDRQVSGSGAFDVAGNVATQMVSVNAFGYQTSGLLGVASTAASNIYPVISSNGRFVALPSDTENNGGLAFGVTNLQPRDTNGRRDVYLFDRRTNASITPATPPTVTITAPGSVQPILVGQTVNVTASATTTTGVIASVQFFVNGTSIGTSNVFPYTAPWTPPVVGNYTLSALVTDSFGNIGVSANVAVTVNAAPSVEITFPTPTTTITTGSTVTVTANAAASNPGATISGVQFFVEGLSLGAADATAPYTASWTPAAGGTYRLHVTAYDSVGTQKTSPTVTVTVTTPSTGGGGGPATPPPSVAISAPAAGSTITVNTPVQVAATASAVGGAVRSVQFLANGAPIATSSTYPFAVPWTPASPGTYALTAIATDHLGVQATSMPTNITVSGGVGPSIALVSPAAGTSIPVGSTQTLVANASAGTGMIASVQFFVNGILLGTDTTFPYNFAWTPAGIGPAVLSAVAIDGVGNQTNSGGFAVNVVPVSATAPAVTITSPASGAALPVGTATTISAAAADPDGTIASVQFFANGVPIEARDLTFPYSAAFTPASPGNYLITAQAIDNGGNITNSAPITVNVAGGTAPTVALTAPAASAIVRVNAPLTITATASSPSGVISSVQFFINGTAIGAADTTFPYAVTWTPLGLGTFSLTARATDNVGNITDSAPIVIRAANSAPPTVAITNPAASSVYTVGTALTIAADAADPDGTITQVQFFVNGLPQGSSDNAAPYLTAWTPQSVGVYALTAQATDDNGNVTTSAPISVTVGANVAPSIALTNPTAGGSYSMGNQVLVAATASDADGTIAKVEFFANGLSLGSGTAAPFVASWRPTAAGNYSLTAVATDNVGNATTTAPITVTITSSGAPAVSVVNPTAGASYVVGNTIPFVAETSGGNGPTAQVQFFVNGAPLGTPDTTSPYAATWTPAAPGTYNLLAVATDSAGISGNSATLNVTITGNAPPTAAITSPSTGLTVNAGTVVSLTAAATDADGTVASVRFLANGNVVASASAAPYIGAWTPTAAGAYTIVAQAQDNSGNVTNSTTITVSVLANQAPTVALTSPANGSAVRIGASLNLTANASDPDGTVASVQFYANGVSIGAPDTSAPYQATYVPAAEGVYRITAVALDNSGAVTTSAAATVAVVSATAGDRIYTGTYAGSGESGRFAAAVVRNKTAAFIGFSTSGSSPVIYYYPSMTVDTAGGFSVVNSVGRTLVSGNANDTGVTGTLDNGRLTMIGMLSFTSGASAIPAGYYVGSLTGRAGSLIAAIVNADGGITLYVEDGTFRDAGAGAISASGSFAITTSAGSRISGVADPATGFVSGFLAGGPSGNFTASLASGASFSDGFLRNLSTRGQVGAGNNILIAGFVVGGNSPKQVLVRAIGPSLAQFGITGALADSMLELYTGSTRIASNDNWGGDSAIQAAANQVGAFPLTASSNDSALLVRLPPGAYTTNISGVGGRTGVALVEIYDADSLTPFSPQKVVNIATRGVVGTGTAQLIAGFAVSGNTPKKVLVRAVGPTLPAVVPGTTGVLADPFLRLVRTDTRDNRVVETVVRENDNWGQGNDSMLITDTAARVGAFPLPAGSRDAAMIVTLPPGIYGAQVTGPGTATGVALVEVYEVP